MTQLQRTTSQPTQYTLLMVRGDLQIEVGYYGTAENADNAQRELIRTLAVIAPETYRRGDIDAVVINPIRKYAPGTLVNVFGYGLGRVVKGHQIVLVESEYDGWGDDMGNSAWFPAAKIMAV